MEVKIHPHDFDLPDELSDFVNSNVYLVLARYSGVVKSVDVILSARSIGDDWAKCLFKLKSKQVGPIIAHSIASNIYDAVKSASKRAQRTLEIRLDRKRKLRRRYYRM